mmetsp:Transcript_8849/g.15053  ORF Transcript_8849/g.15053 Transcript_8849/m.15053 type:complete len:234 (+) Transcript_8849:241-942(+)
MAAMVENESIEVACFGAFCLANAVYKDKRLLQRSPKGIEALKRAARMEDRSIMFLGVQALSKVNSRLPMQLMLERDRVISEALSNHVNGDYRSPPSPVARKKGAEESDLDRLWRTVADEMTKLRQDLANCRRQVSLLKGDVTVVSTLPLQEAKGLAEELKVARRAVKECCRTREKEDMMQTVREDLGRACKICNEADANTVLLPCRHLHTCVECLQQRGCSSIYRQHSTIYGL